nr:helix-turn-helix domain-containing protein [Streptomyces sp. WM6378]
MLPTSIIRSCPPDSVHTVAAALLDHIAGHGHRPIAERLHRPASTVRGWLRRATALAAFWRRHGVIYAYRLDPDAGPFQRRTTALAEALDALGVLSMSVVNTGWS